MPASRPGPVRPRTPRASTRSTTRSAARATAPVLVRQIRNGIEESVHRGDIVEVNPAGAVIRVLGDPERLVTLRSSLKPFGVVALLEMPGAEDLDLEPTEIAVMASSHSGEDVHVRTIQAAFRRTGVTQSFLGCGTAGAPLDPLTAARLARDGEIPGPIRHMCSGHHAMLLLMCKLAGWEPTGYWHDEHPAQVRYREVVARTFGTVPDRLVAGIDGCGIPTYAFPLREVARAYAMLADPSGVPASDPRSSLAGPLTRIRDAMLANPEMVAGTRDRVDTSLMKAAPGRIVSKGGAEGLRGVAVLPGPRGGDGSAAASGLAIKIEDGGGYDRATWAATIEALRQAGVLDTAALRHLARYHRPQIMDPHGRVGAESIPVFDLAPVGELI